MDNNLLSWIIDQVDKEKLLNICSEKIVISGFRDPKRAPKKCIANKLLKNKEKLFVDLKKYADKLEINDKFKDKTFEEIEKLIDIEYKNEIIELVIYLSTRSKDQYTNLANKVIDLISQKHVETKKCIDEKNLEHENFKKIDDLCKIIKTQQINLDELKKENNKLICNNKKLKTQIENYKKDKIKLNYLIVKFKEKIVKLKKQNLNNGKSCEDEIAAISNEEDERLNSKTDKRILLVGANNICDFDIPLNLRNKIDILEDNDIDNIYINNYIEQYKILWIFTFNLSTQSEFKLSKVNMKKVEFDNLQQFKVYIRKEVNA